MKQVLKDLWTWRKHNAWGWGEAAGLTLLTLVFCYYMNPTNPLFIKASFPWPWIASVIIVFQYGLGPSLLTAGIISVAALFLRDAGGISLIDFQSYLLSGVTLILICALFSSSWARRMMNAEVIQHYNEDRLNSLSRSYYMLRVSFDYLEQDIITKPLTLRLALKELQQLNITQGKPLSQDVAYSFLQIISQFCLVNIAGIFLYQNKSLSLDPFVQIGSMEPLIINDPLIKKGMSSNEMCYVSINQMEDASDCLYLVAIPLIGKGKQLGMLVIQEMPFWNLNEEKLRILNILTHYFIEEISFSPETRDFLNLYPSCPSDFANQLSKLAPLKKDMEMDSALVAVMVVKKLRPHNVIYNLKNQHRLLDSFWSLELEDYDVLITLMPFASGAGIQGYQTRIRKYLSSDLGLSLEHEQIKIRSMQLYGEDPIKTMKYFLQFIEEKNIA